MMRALLQRIKAERQNPDYGDLIQRGWAESFRSFSKHESADHALKLFEDAAKRKFDLVLFWALDRFSREGTLATLQHLQRLSSYGVDRRSYQESYLDY